MMPVVTIRLTCLSIIGRESPGLRLDNRTDSERVDVRSVLP